MKRLDGDGYGATTVGTRLEELHKSKGMQYGSYPRFTVAVKGKKVTIKFQIHTTCKIALFISNIVANLGVKVKERATSSDMNLRAWDSGVAWQLTLNRPEMEFIKQGSFTAEELDALVSVLKLAGVGQNRSMDKSRDNARNSSMDKSVTSLQGMRVKIYGLKEPKLEYSKSEIAWENIAGYNQPKRGIEDTILLALHFRVLRYWKTSSARVIANEAAAPLLYVPLEVIMSKHFGESEKLLGKVFSHANEIPNDPPSKAMPEAHLEVIESNGLATPEAYQKDLAYLKRKVDARAEVIIPSEITVALEPIKDNEEAVRNYGVLNYSFNKIISTMQKMNIHVLCSYKSLYITF
ncbi:hypothetical protein L2E82_15796 [Cichorium intybus]|uniref:Uncharacterized protein n=1 Tax=Cichorium intybus TaxID=13427 RepID=A0ACB9F4N9_CICIN|nr:hypothetical protein L2E82_15796 [Cichorium intybus]